MGQASTIGLDIAKWVFQAHGADATGRVVFRKRLVRAKVLEFFRACCKLWRRPHEGLCRPQFHALFTVGRPKQTDSNRFCSHTVQAPGKANPFRSHSMASNPRIVRRAVWKD